MKESINKKLDELFKGTELEDFDYKNQESADDLIEYLEERILDDQIIYYSNAIEYLANNDASLKDSIALAIEMGFTLENLSSEVLATLLSQYNMRQELYKLKDEIEQIYNDEEE